MIRLLKSASLASTLAFLPGILAADDITDALDSARQAYEDGDVQYALDELDYARQLLMTMKTDALGAYLPDAPDGWTREINSEMNAGMAMMGGGVGAEAEYTGPDGGSYTITMMADNPMIASMAAVLANASVMGMRVERIGRQRFVIQDGEVSGIVANRVMIQASGDDPAQLLEVLARIDFRALGNFGN